MIIRMEWIALTMSEVWDILATDMPPEMKKVFIKPDFPTRRWNQISTKVSTTDKKSLEKCASLIDIPVKISIDKENSEKFKTKLYKIEIKLWK